MPLFLSRELHYDKLSQANLLSLFEVGAVAGALALGALSDCFYSRRAPVCVMAVAMASFIAFYLAFRYEELSTSALGATMFFFGFNLGSVAHMINTVCAADLGRENAGKRAASTITGIIDACGNTGAGLGQIILGVTIDAYGW